MKLAASAVMIGVAVVGVVGVPARAGAVPGDPLDGCITSFGQQLCDGPIREDGSWKRCLFSEGIYGDGGFNAPPVANCFIVPGVGQIPPFPLGQPQFHITG